jgi:hypothetical protein
MNIPSNSIPPNRIDRHIDQALRREPDAGPPADFARSVAARVAQASGQASVWEPRMERWLLRGLALVFAGATLAVVALYGREWITGFALLLPAAASATALNWMLALLACVALSWSFERLRLASHRR